MNIFGFLAYIMGPLMKFLYQFIPNYALAIIVFTLLLKLASFPLQIKQQKSMAKMSVFTPMINEIQQKYKNNQEKQNEEMMRLQQEYGFSPTAGCLPMALNMFVLFGMYQVVYQPLQYILGISSSFITTVCQTSYGVSQNWNINTSQPAIIQAVKAGVEGLGFTAEQTATIANFNTDFLGMDMLDRVINNGFHLSPIIIFPLLAAVTMILSNIITQRVSGQQAQMQGTMKIMMWAMNLWFCYWCFTMPVAFSLYYAVSNLCMLVQSIVTHKFYSPEKFKAQYEAEVAAKKAARKQKKEVKLVENGKEVTKELGLSELNKLRLERARAMDAEKYKDERTRPLTEEEKAAEAKKTSGRADKKKTKKNESPETAAEADKEAADHVEELKKREDQ